MADPNPALLARTARTLRERFEALRPIAPISAILAESPLGHSHARTGPGNMPEIPFETHKRCKPRWCGGSMVICDGQSTNSKELWVCCDAREWERISEICKAANPFVPLIRRTHGLPPDCGTTDPLNRWIWTVFSLAEVRVPYSLLALENGGAFRFSESGGFISPEATLESVNENPTDFAAAILSAQTWSPVRYRQLADLIEASIMVMDLVEVAIVDGQTAASPQPSEPPEPTAKKKGGRPHKRTVEGLDCNQWLAAVFAKNPADSQLSDAQLSKLSREQGPGWSASAIRQSDVRIAQRNMDKAAAQEEYKARAADTEEELGMNGIRLSKRKTATGQQRRASPEDRAEEARDRAHDAAADDFIAAAEAAAAKKRPAQ